MLRFIYLLGIFIILGLFVKEIIQFRGKLARAGELIETTTPFSFTPATPTMRILMAGDSSAVGVGAKDAKLSTAGRIHELYPYAEITNIAVSGLRTAGLVTTLEQFEAAGFDLVVLQIGGNDIVRFTNFQELETNIVHVLERAQTMGQRVVLLTAGNVGTAPIFPWPLSWIYTQRTLKVRKIFSEQAAQHKAHYVDIYEPRTRDPFVHDPATYYAADGFHPSDEGYGVWYEKIKAVLQEK